MLDHDIQCFQGTARPYVKGVPYQVLINIGPCCKKWSVSTTEYTEMQPLLSGEHSVMRVKFALAGEGGVHALPLYYIYHHQ